MRLSGRRAFGRVYHANARKNLGLLTMLASPNALPFSRLGLSVSRKVGTAVKRNRIKRLLRESFRLQQHLLPVGMDWLIIVRPHEPRSLEEYQRLLQEGTEALKRQWDRRTRKEQQRDKAVEP